MVGITQTLVSDYEVARLRLHAALVVRFQVVPDRADGQPCQALDGPRTGAPCGVMATRVPVMSCTCSSSPRMPAAIMRWYSSTMIRRWRHCGCETGEATLTA